MPDWTMQLRERLAGLRLDPAREAEIVEEIAQHLNQRYEEVRDSGLDHEAAMELAGRELGETEGLSDDMRRLRQAGVPVPLAPGAPRGRWLGDLWLDLRLAVRMLRKQSGLTAAAVLTLAFGIGANGAIFALVDRVLLRELPFPDPGRLMTISERTETTPASRVSPLNLLDWNASNRSFESIAGYMRGVGAMVMSDASGAENVTRQWVTAGIFSTLGLRPIIGRTFLPTDDEPQSRLVVLSEAEAERVAGCSQGRCGAYRCASRP